MNEMDTISIGEGTIDREGRNEAISAAKMILDDVQYNVVEEQQAKQENHGVKGGRLLWDSFHNGTYIKSKHGELK